MLMRSMSIPLLIFSWMLPAIGQERVQSLDNTNAWIFHALPRSNSPGHFFRFKSGDEVDKIVADIMGLYSLPTDFEVYRGPVDSAAARIEYGRRVIYYSQDWFLRHIGEDRWQAITVMAHEIGHHLSGHTLTKHNDRQKQELEADKFAGSVVAHLGGSLADAQRAYMNLPKNFTTTHPSRRARLEAVAVGWNDARSERPGTYLTF